MKKNCLQYIKKTRNCKPQFTPKVFCLVLFFLSFNLHAQPTILDAADVNFEFKESNRIVEINNGNNGLNEGSVHRFLNVATVESVDVDVLISIQRIVNASVLAIDEDYLYGNPVWLQPKITTSGANGGFVSFSIKFVQSGSSEPVFIKNYSLSALDIDGFGTSQREFVEFSGFHSYTTNTQTGITVENGQISGGTRFWGKPKYVQGLAFENLSSVILSTNNPVSEFLFAAGTFGTYPEANFSFQMGLPAGIFSSPTTVSNSFPIAVNDILPPVNAGLNAPNYFNVLQNDFYLGRNISESEHLLSIVKPASNQGVTLNTSTGYISVEKTTPPGIYEITYKACAINPAGKCDTAIAFVQVAAANIEFALQSTKSSLLAGEDNSYLFTVKNNGPLDAYGVEVIDTFPAGLTVLKTLPSRGFWEGAKWMIGHLPAGAQETLRVDTKVASSYWGNLLNRAKASSQTFDPDATNNVGVNISTVGIAYDLSVQIDASQDIINSGNEIEYTITATNNGPSDASGVMVNTTFSPALTNFNVECTAGSWNKPTWNVGSLPSGKSEKMTVQAKVLSHISGSISSSVSLMPSPYTLNPANDQSTEVTFVNSQADISITQQCLTDTLIVGNSSNFIFSITNNGPGDASTLQVISSFSDAFYQTLYSDDNGASWNNWESPFAIESLSTGKTVILLINASLKAESVDATSISNVVSFVSQTPDPLLDNNISQITIPLQAQADLKITRSGPDTINAGEQITYTILIENDGPSLAKNIIVSDTLCQGIENAMFSLDNGATWDYWYGNCEFATIGYKGKIPILLRGNVANHFSGNLQTGTTVSSDARDGNLSNNSAQNITIVNSETDLSIIIYPQTSIIQKDSEAVFAVEVQNLGSSLAQNVAIFDSLVSEYFSISSFLLNNQWVSWSDTMLIGDIEAGYSAAFAIKGIVSPNAPDSIVLALNVTSNTSDVNIENNRFEYKSFLQDEADLAIYLQCDSSVVAGEVSEFSLKIKNIDGAGHANDIWLNIPSISSHFDSLLYSLDNGVHWQKLNSNLNTTDLAQGDSIIVKLKAFIASSAEGLCTFSARVFSSSGDSSLLNNYISNSLVFKSVADLSLSHGIISAYGSPVAGENIVMWLNCTNNGPSDVPLYVISNDFTSIFSSAEAVIGQNVTVPWTEVNRFGILKAGETAMLKIAGKLHPDLKGIVSDRYIVTKPVVDPISSNDTSIITFAVQQQSDLKIIANSPQNPVFAGDTVYYALIVENLGPSDADSLTLSGNFIGGSNNVKYSIDNGATWNNWQNVNLLGQINYNETINILVAYPVIPTFINGQVISNSFEVSSKSTDLNTLNNYFTHSKTIQACSRLNLTARIGDSEMSLGESDTLTIAILNNGPSVANDVKVNTMLPAGIQYVADDRAEYDPATGVWNAGVIQPNETRTLKISFIPTNKGQYVNRIVASSTVQDDNMADNVLLYPMVVDRESQYVVNKQNIDTFVPGTVFASANDSDGVVVSASILSGSLSSGMSFNSVNGNVVVVNPNMLIPGVYKPIIKTIDNHGGVTISEVDLTVHPENETVYYVTFPKLRDNYANGEVLATSVDADGAVVSTTFVSGTLPPGIGINPVNGYITVINRDVLQAGNHSIAISSTDEKGGKTSQQVIVRILSDNEAEYTLPQAKNVDEYFPNDLMASVADIDGAIISASIVDGVLPAGLSLNPINGEIVVADTSLLIMSSRPLMVETIDEKGGLTRSYILLKIGIEQKTVYSVMPAKNVDLYRVNDTLAFANDANGEVISATVIAGQLPAGASLDGVSGLIKVENPGLLVAGFYNVSIRTTDKQGNQSTQQLTLIILADREAQYFVQASKNVSSYIDNDILATVYDPDGEITAAEVVLGQLPVGVAFSSITGSFSVSNKSLLVPKAYPLTVKTTDITGGISFNTIQLSFLATDIQLNMLSYTETVVAGDTIDCQIEVSNNGPFDADNILITYVLPEGITSAQYSKDSGRTWIQWPIEMSQNIGNLKNGEKKNLFFRMIVDGLHINNIVNTISVLSSVEELKNTDNSVNFTVIVSPACDLLVTITDEKPGYLPGSIIEYIMQISNQSAASVSGARVVHTPSVNTTVTGWVATGSAGTIFLPSGNGNVDQFVTIPAWGTITYKVWVSVPDSYSGTLSSSASVSAPAPFTDTDQTNNISTDNNVLSDESRLILTKTLDQSEAYAGDTIVFTIKLQNNSPNEASNVIITDQLPEGLIFVSASTGGLHSNGVVTWSSPLLLPGSSLIARLETKIKSSVNDNTIIRNQAKANAENATDEIESNPADVLVHRQSVLVISKQSERQTIEAGVPFNYTIEITNYGPSDIDNVEVTDYLPSELQYVADNNGGVLSDNDVIWNSGILPAGENKVFLLTVTADEKIPDGSVIQNVASINPSVPGSGVLSDTVRVTVNSKASFEILLETEDSVMAGDYMEYRITVSNTSVNKATSVVVANQLPEGLNFVSASNQGSADGNSVTWTLSSLYAGEIKQFILRVQASAGLPHGTLIQNHVSVSATNSGGDFLSNQTTTKVISIPLVANDDIGTPLIGTEGGIVLPNILENDLYGGNTISLSTVSIYQVFATDHKINLETSTGRVMVEKGTSAGKYELNYRVCLLSVPAFCDTAKVTIDVLQPALQANEDVGELIDNMQGGEAVANVLDNDIFNGLPCEISEVTLSVLQPAPVEGIDFDVQTGRIYVQQGTSVGNYEIVYSLCDVVNPLNCDNAVVTISVTDQCDLLVPTGFSPNGDQINDRFMIRCIGRYPNATMAVYNRWGNLVYSKSNYGNTDIWGEEDAWWDGTSTNSLAVGEELPTGTYLYILDLKNGNDKPKTGSIFLNR